MKKYEKYDPFQRKNGKLGFIWLTDTPTLHFYNIIRLSLQWCMWLFFGVAPIKARESAY